MTAVAAPPTRPFRWSVVAAVLAKDLRATRRSKAVVVPMLVVPAVLLVGLPAGLGRFARASTPPDLSGIAAHLPAGIADRLAGLDARQQLLVLVLGYLVAPLFLIVPMMVSAALAADTFAGEKERRTLESLLHLPVEERELYVAKVLFAFLPAVGLSWTGFALFVVAADWVAWPVMGRLLLPTAEWTALIVVVAPAVAALGLGIMVRVSARAATTQEANQLGGAVIMPIILATVGQASGVLVLGVGWVLGVGAVVWLLALWLVRGGMRRFTRDAVAARL